MPDILSQIGVIDLGPLQEVLDFCSGSVKDMVKEIEDKAQEELLQLGDQIKEHMGLGDDVDIGMCCGSIGMLTMVLNQRKRKIGSTRCPLFCEITPPTLTSIAHKHTHSQKHFTKSIDLFIFYHTGTLLLIVPY